jgi:hypothetical protein
MRTLGVKNLALEALKGVVTLDGTTARVGFRGNADMGSHAAFRDFIAALHTEVVRVGITLLELDLTELYFMNSSCLSIVAGLISTVAGSPPPARFHILLRTNPNLRWQKRSVQALCGFASDLVTAV